MIYDGIIKQMYNLLYARDERYIHSDKHGVFLSVSRGSVYCNANAGASDDGFALLLDDDLFWRCLRKGISHDCRILRALLMSRSK